MKTWVVVGTLVVVAAIVIALTLPRDDDRDDAPASFAHERADIAKFQATERACIAAFNDALRRQRANEIDEIELAAIVERDVVAPWRTMRESVMGARIPDAKRELYASLHRYVEVREAAWQAYVTALRAPSDAEARGHYDRYHQKNADADREARTLGPMLRR